jgi:hypothetical protein
MHIFTISIAGFVYALLHYPCVRHGYPWVPTGQAHGRPYKWVRPARRPADLFVGPTDLDGGPHDLLKTF